MAVIGGVCFYLIGLINEFLEWRTPLVQQCLIACGYVLAVEFVSGCIFNLMLGWHIWDYSQEPFNLLGQVCLKYAILWYFVSAIAIVLDDFCRWILFDEEKPRYKIF